MDRSARVFSGDLLCCSILPPMCSRNVRSVVSMTATPSIAASAPTIVSQCSLPEASTVMSRSRTPSLTSTRSMDPIDAPTCPIALATRPSMPGRSAISTRIVRLYWADGEGDIRVDSMGSSRADDRRELRTCMAAAGPSPDRAGRPSARAGTVGRLTPVSRAQWLAAIGAIAAAGGAPASALGAQGAQATVRAYVAAVQARDAGRVCSLLDGDAFDSERSCRSLLRDELRADRLARVSVEGVLVRVAHARAVVDLVTRAGRTVEPSRARMLLRRSGGHWRVTGSGTLPGTGPYVHTRAGDDPQPAAAQALRRLADDELLALSGNGGMLCDLLAPGAPLGGHRGACWNAVFSSVHWGGGRALRLARYAEHRIGARRARLDVTIAATRAHGTRRRPGYALTTTLWRDTLHAVRAGGHWRLVKPSRAFYLAVGQPPPSDVTAPAPTATWPLDDAALPSLTQTPMPAACRVPSALWGAHYCGQIDGLAAAPVAEGGGAVAWSREFSTQTRTVAAGGAAGPAVTSQVASPRGDELWHVVDHGLVSVAGGALLV